MCIRDRAYIMVDDQPDGKVKVELGDDPDRTGSYSFSFTLHNLTAVSYTHLDVYKRQGRGWSC